MVGEQIALSRTLWDTTMNVTGFEKCGLNGSKTRDPLGCLLIFLFWKAWLVEQHFDFPDIVFILCNFVFINISSTIKELTVSQYSSNEHFAYYCHFMIVGMSWLSLHINLVTKSKGFLTLEHRKDMD